jgi:hypothetical protein
MQTDPDRLPKTGDSARVLGVRPHRHRSVDTSGLVAPMTGGMSITADDPMNLPPHRRSARYNEAGCDPVFEIHGDSFGGSLSLRHDGRPSQYLVEPHAFCLFEDYQMALHATRPFWLLLESCS